MIHLLEDIINIAQGIHHLPPGNKLRISISADQRDHGIHNSFRVIHSCHQILRAGSVHQSYTVIVQINVSCPAVHGVDLFQRQLAFRRSLSPGSLCLGSRYRKGCLQHGTCHQNPCELSDSLSHRIPLFYPVFSKLHQKHRPLKGTTHHLTLDSDDTKSV